MYEKVNPAHPDKVMDRIAGALVDLAYTKSDRPIIAVEGVIGHGKCSIIAETSIEITKEEVQTIVDRIAGPGIKVDFLCVPQDTYLAQNQANGLRCGDNGIFKGAPVTYEQQLLADFAGVMYNRYSADGKYIIDGREVIIC